MARFSWSLRHTRRLAGIFDAASIATIMTLRVRYRRELQDIYPLPRPLPDRWSPVTRTKPRTVPLSKPSVLPAACTAVGRTQSMLS